MCPKRNTINVKNLIFLRFQERYLLFKVRITIVQSCHIIVFIKTA